MKSKKLPLGLPGSVINMGMGEKITESRSDYSHLEKMTVTELLTNINTEDKKVAFAIEKEIPRIEDLVVAVTHKLLTGGRLFYIGAGTSGRLGIVDASECPSTFGISPDTVIGIIAGGKKAITEAAEFAEDDIKQGWKDLKKHTINNKDIVIGIAASGTTPYVINALKKCRTNGIVTGSISCNPGSPVSSVSDFPVEVVTGPEFITGSTRMKAGTAEKMLLNMISTTVMIRLGRVEDNYMVNMKIVNEKMLTRGIKMLMEELKIKDPEIAGKLLLRYGTVKKAIKNYHL